jgi:hypothetical protein
MFKIFYAEKDATLYESAPIANTGIDELLEIGKQIFTSGSNLLKSRFVIKFDMNEITDSLTKYNKTVNDCKFVLQLYTSHAKNLPADYTIYSKLVGESWINGTGYDGGLTADGVSWQYPISGGYWISSSQDVQIGSSSLYIAGTGEGGNYLYKSGSGSTAGLITSESFSYRTTDLNMDVTNAVKLWISGSEGEIIPNNGFLFQFSDTDEANDAIRGFIKFFSRETHTIYVPRITMYWDNHTFSTGSLIEIDTDSYLVYTNVKPSYKDNEIAKIRMFARDKYPQKSPTNLFPQTAIKYLPETTYYTVLDAATDETIIPYDDIYTKISCDSTSNFIYLDLNGFMPERYYRLELKVVNGIEEQYITDQIYFKVVR